MDRTGLEPGRESTRHDTHPALLDDSVRDLRHGARVLQQAPGFAAAALVTLALGIGATSAIYSLVRAVMLEPLPDRDPDRIVAVWETNRGGGSRNVIAPANFVAWRERVHTLEHLGMVGPANLARASGASISRGRRTGSSHPATSAPSRRTSSPR